MRSEEHTSELQSRENLVCRLLLEKKKKRSAISCATKKTQLGFILVVNPCCLSVSSITRRTRTSVCVFFFFNDTATTEIYTLSLHDALPISSGQLRFADVTRHPGERWVR